MEWTADPTITRATLDGRDLTPIVDEQLFWSESLSVDWYTTDAKGWLYWAESFYYRVERVHYDGTGRQTIVALESPSVVSSVVVFKVLECPHQSLV